MRRRTGRKAEKDDDEKADSKPKDLSRRAIYPPPIFRPPPRGGGLGASKPMGIRILVIEDDEEIADFVVRGLREEGYTVEHAADGERRLARPPGRPLGRRRARLVAAGAGRPDAPAAVPPGRPRRTRPLPDGQGRGLRPGAGPRPRGRRLPLQAVRLRGAAGPRPGPGPAAGEAGRHVARPRRRPQVDLATHRAERAGQRLDLTAKEQALLRLLPAAPRRGALPHPDLRARLGRAVRRRSRTRWSSTSWSCGRSWRPTARG